MFITQSQVLSALALRTIAPLNDRDWEILVKDLEKGPTDEQAEFIHKAIERVRSLNMSIRDYDG